MTYLNTNLWCRATLRGILFLVILFAPLTANATLISFNIVFNPTTSGVGGSGQFDVNSSDLAEIPASGLYYGRPFTIQNFNATVAGIVYESFEFNAFVTSDGQISGITALLTTHLISPSTPGDARLIVEDCVGAPCFWSATNHQGTQLGEGTYVISAAPEPATLAIFGLGLAGLGLMRRRKLTA